MSALTQRRPHTPVDDAGTGGASHFNGGRSRFSQLRRASGSGGASEHVKFGEAELDLPSRGSNLGEYEQLDRFITNYDIKRRASMATATGYSCKKPSR